MRQTSWYAIHQRRTAARVRCSTAPLRDECMCLHITDLSSRRASVAAIVTTKKRALTRTHRLRHSPPHSPAARLSQITAPRRTLIIGMRYHSSATSRRAFTSKSPGTPSTPTPPPILHPTVRTHVHKQAAPRSDSAPSSSRRTDPRNQNVPKFNPKPKRGRYIASRTGYGLGKTSNSSSNLKRGVCISQCARDGLYAYISSVSVDKSRQKRKPKS